MTGLEKITGRILEAARADAEATLAEAKKQADAIRADYAARADEAHARLCAEAEREGENIIGRAKSSAAMTRRNILLAAESDLIEETFRQAEKELHAMDKDAYRDFLAGLLVVTLTAQREAERVSREMYGEEDAPDYSHYEILFNQQDKSLAPAVMDALRRLSVGKIDRVLLEKLRVSEQTADIDGGFILRMGDLELNCSLSALMAQAREKDEATVSEMLFG